MKAYSTYDSTIIVTDNLVVTRQLFKGGEIDRSGVKEEAFQGWRYYLVVYEISVQSLPKYPELAYNSFLIIDPRYEWSIFSSPIFQTPAKPAPDWLKEMLRAVGCSRIHV